MAKFEQWSILDVTRLRAEVGKWRWKRYSHGFGPPRVMLQLSSGASDLNGFQISRSLTTDTA